MDRPATAILTFLITDIRGYTSYTQQRGDEAAARLAATFAEIAREGVEARGGDVIELRGDEVLAVFQSPRSALRAAVDLQLVLADEVELHPDRPMYAGIGLDAGEAIPVEHGYRGGALNLAARLCGQAAAGEVLASQGLLQLARAVDGLAFHEHGELELKGLDAPVRVARVSPADVDPDALTARFTQAAMNDGSGPIRSEVPAVLDVVTPMVGRERELRRLRWAWRQARRGAPADWFVIGPTGIGKTRLLAELAQSVADDGCAITYTSLRSSPAPDLTADSADGQRPTLLVVDDLEADDAAAGDWLRQLAGNRDRSRMLVVSAFDDVAASPELVALAHRGGDQSVVRPPPLDGEQIRAVADLYLGPGAGSLPAAVLDDTGGIPQRIHERVSGWAHAEARRRLGAAASRAAVGRSDLRTVESELAGSVVDLQLVRERARLYEAGPGRAEPVSPESPFMGLATFDVDDADLFFGRERLVAELIARLAGASFLGVVGPSGSGKSSAVRAGLIPAVRSGVLPGSESWLIALMRPGGHPLRELDRAVWASLPDALRSRLQGAELPLSAVRDELADGECLIVVMDQFEETYTACTDPAERAAFIGALTEAANDARRRAVVIVAVRADFYGRCAEDPALAELLGANHVLVGPMTAEEYRRAIEQPAQRVGIRIEPALTDALVGEVVDEPGGLPLLSTALLELWEHRDGRSLRLDAYVQTGGVRGAVARLAEDAYSTFDDQDRAVVRSVFLRLTGTGEGDAVVRRRVPLVEFDTERNEVAARVIGRLTDRRLLTVSEGTVEVAHEALLREWPRLQEWLDEDRAGRRLRGHLTEAAREWSASGRESGELYRGARLATALDWTTEHTLDLNELERDFVNSSRLASEQDAQRQRRTNRRLRGLLAGAAIFLVVAVVAGVLAVIQRGEAETATIQATAQRLGAQAVVEDELDLSLLLARQGYEIDASTDTESTLLASILKAPAAIAVLPGTGNRVLLIRGAADGSVLATTDNSGGVAIYTTSTLRLERTVQFDTQYWFDISPDGATLAGSTFSEGPLVALVATQTGAISRIPLPDGADFVGAVSVSFHPSGEWFADVECRDCENDPTPVLVRRDPTDGSELASEPLPVTFRVDSIFYADDGNELVVVGSDDESGVVEFLDADTLASSHTLRGEFFVVDLSPDGQTLAVGREDGSVVLVDVATGDEEAMDGRHNASVQGIGFSPDGSALLSTGDDRVVIVWDVEPRAIREILHGHAGRITWQPAFDADGATAFTVGLDSKVIAWDLTGERRIGRALPVADGQVGQEGGSVALATAATADGSAVATTTSDGGVMVIDPGSGEARWEVDPWSEERMDELRAEDPAYAEAISGWVMQLAFSGDGRSLAVAGENPELVVYDVGTGAEVRRWKASRHGFVNGVSFAGDGSIVTANDDGRVVIWDPQTWQPDREYEIVPEAPDTDSWVAGAYKALVSPDGSRLAVMVQHRDAPMDVTVLDRETGERRWTEQADAFNATVAWSPDSRTIALGGWQAGKLTLRSAETGQVLLEPVNASAGFVISTEYSPDGDLIVTSGTDGTVRLWQATTLKQVGTALPQSDNEDTTAHVVGGDTVLSVSTIGKMWRWDLDPQRWAEQACTVANRTLTEAEWQLFLGGVPYQPACVAP